MIKIVKIFDDLEIFMDKDIKKNGYLAIIHYSDLTMDNCIMEEARFWTIVVSSDNESNIAHEISHYIIYRNFPYCFRGFTDVAECLLKRECKHLEIKGITLYCNKKELEKSKDKFSHVCYPTNRCSFVKRCPSYSSFGESSYETCGVCNLIINDLEGYVIETSKLFQKVLYLCRDCRNKYVITTFPDKI